jgi:hypothetical protein
MSASVAHPHAAARNGHKPRMLRGRVWLRRRELDRRLAAGVDPSTSAELTYRAKQLLSPRCRRSFAAGLMRILEAAEEPANSLSAAVPVRRREILEARGGLIELADLLKFEDKLQVRGLALMDPLLTSGDSPLFHSDPEERLEHSLGRIRAALLLR